MRETVPPALKRFIWDIQSMVELADSEREILLIGRDLMARLVAADDWLPAFAAPRGGEPVRQVQLYADAMERFCVVATLLDSGAALPILKEPAWEIAGALRGVVLRRRYALPEGAPPQPRGEARALAPGAVDTFPARSGDGLALEAAAVGPAVVIQVHGAEIGGLVRRAFGPAGEIAGFATCYANPPDAPAYDILSIQTRIAD